MVNGGGAAGQRPAPQPSPTPRHPGIFCQWPIKRKGLAGPQPIAARGIKRIPKFHNPYHLQPYPLDGLDPGIDNPGERAYPVIPTGLATAWPASW